MAAYAYRHFIITSIINEFRSRFARSKIGGFWMILHPLAQVLMYALVLSAVLSAKLPGLDNKFSYAIYLTAGMLAWTLFSDVVTRCLTVFIDNGNLIKKIRFPRICFPLIVVGSSLINSTLLFLSIIMIFALLGHYPDMSILWMPILFLMPTFLGLGLGLLLGVFNVFVRDVGQIVPVLLQFGFWFTPIVYTPNIIPDSYRNWLFLNPMYHVASAYQNVLVYLVAPEWEGLLVVLCISLGLLGVSLFIFRKASAEMTDVL